MAHFENTLKLDRCPHCRIDKPNLVKETEFDSANDSGYDAKVWGIFVCLRCGNVVSAWSYEGYEDIEGTFPTAEVVDSALPSRVASFLQQAIDSVHAPSGSVMLCASAVDEMLKVKGYDDIKESLYTRIERAQKDGVLTEDMTKWAHQVRLDANDQRHADRASVLPTINDAQLLVEFTKTLAEFLFVLPAKVTRGITSSGQSGKLRKPTAQAVANAGLSKSKPPVKSQPGN